MFNPQTPVQVSPQDYERQVVRWLSDANKSPVDLTIEHLKNLEGSGGLYEIDAVATLILLGGMEIKIIVECKRYSRKVEREVLLALQAKKEDVRAQKAMIFSTSGFQSRAIDYASEKGICCVSFLDGQALMMTKGFDAPKRDLSATPKSFAGVMLARKEDGNIHGSTIDFRHVEPLAEWLRA
ncbi:restriction endonuclease [Polaromonas sp. YR568]|uniref:restriction endonuclease n=1 Tax=Polaromonas sp. YR568 TaxID=1855301 RepID=UPI00398C0C51